MSDLFTHISETNWLKIIYSYLEHQVDPQPSIPLDYLESLHLEDVDAVTPDMFEMHEYSKEDIEDMMRALNLIILKNEKKC